MIQSQSRRTKTKKEKGVERKGAGTQDESIKEGLDKDLIGRLKDLGVFEEADPESLEELANNSQEAEAVGAHATTVRVVAPSSKEEGVPCAAEVTVLDDGNVNRNGSFVAVRPFVSETKENEGGNEQEEAKVPNHSENPGIELIRGKSDEEEVMELIQQEEKREIARDIIYDNVLPKVFEDIEERADATKVSSVKPSIHVVNSPVLVEAQPWSPSQDSGPAPMVVQPIIVNTRISQVDPIPVQVQGSDQTQMHLDMKESFEYPDVSSTDIGGTQEEKIGEEGKQIGNMETKNSEIDGSRIERAVQVEFKEKPSRLVSRPQIQQDVPLVSVSQIEHKQPSFLAQHLEMTPTAILQPSQEAVQREDTALVLRLDSGSLIADLEPLTGVLDSAVKDKTHRLPSDLVALGIMKGLDEKAAEEMMKFKEQSCIDAKTPFYLLVEKFYEAERRLASAPLLLELCKVQFESDLIRMWPREIKTISKTLAGAKNGVQVSHEINYNHTWVSEKDAKVLVKNLQGHSKLLLPKLVKQRFDDRIAFLAVELYLFEVQHSERGCNGNEMTPYPLQNQRLSRMHRLLECISILFYFLNKPMAVQRRTSVDGKSNGTVTSSSPSLQLIHAYDSPFHNCIHTWIKIVTNWVYLGGDLGNQEFIFRHLIKARGLQRHHHAPPFPLKVTDWGGDVNRHFLKIMYLLLSPVVEKDSANIGRGGGLGQDVRVVKSIMKAAEDVKRDARDVDVANWKAALAEEDLVHLIESMPVKKFLDYIFMEAFKSAIGNQPGWEANVNRVMGTAKSLIYMIGNAMRSLPTYIQFREQLCKVLCWTMQCLVDSYVLVTSPLSSPSSEPQNKDAMLRHYSPPSNQFERLLSREIDWLCARCVCLVNSTDSPPCRAYLCMFPLHHLSPEGASLVFQVIFRNLPLENLLDSGYKVEPLAFDGWQAVMECNAHLRKHFFAQFDKDETGKAQGADSGDIMAPLAALNLLAEKQEQVDSLPVIWLHELFLAAFVNTSTRESLSVRCQPLINSLCAVHPAATSHLLKDLDTYFYGKDSNLAQGSHSKAQGDVESALLRTVQKLNLSLYDVSRRDCEIIRKFMDKQGSICYTAAVVFLEKFAYPDPGTAIPPTHFQLSCPGGGLTADYSDQKSTEREMKEHDKVYFEHQRKWQRLQHVAELLIVVLGEIRLSHVISVSGSKGGSIPGPSTDWWCNILCKIFTHDFRGQPISQRQQAHFPSQSFLDQLGRPVDTKTARQYVIEDPVLRYINMVIARSSHQLSSFKNEGWPVVQWLLKQGPPVNALGHKALFSLLPGLVDQGDLSHLEIIEGVLNEEKRTWGRSHVEMDAAKSILAGHIATLAIREVQQIKAKIYYTRWNALFSTGAGTVAKTLKFEDKSAGSIKHLTPPPLSLPAPTEGKKADEKGQPETPPAPATLAPSSPVEEKQLMKVMDAIQVSIPPKSKIVSFWMNQIAARENGARIAAGQPPAATGTQGKGWLANDVGRALMDHVIHALYRLQPSNRNHTLRSLSKFFQKYIKDHGKLNHRQHAGSGLEPPVSPLGSRADQNVKYPWLTFQILIELTELNRVNWIALGETCVSKASKKRVWKKVLKDVDPTNNKIILWESVIREWVRHAIYVSAEHPLLPAYWQRFFAMYFSRLPFENKDTKSTDRYNPGRFFGYRYLLGNTGDQLVRKAISRLDALAKHWNANLKRGRLTPQVIKRVKKVAKMYEAMSLWLSVKPKTANKLVTEWGALPNSGEGFGLSIEEKKLLETGCPRDLGEATTWHVNQLAIRARIGALPEKYCTEKLIAAIGDEAIDRSRKTLWLDVGMEEVLDKDKDPDDINKLLQHAQALIPIHLLRSTFSRRETGLLELECEPARSPAFTLRRQTQFRSRRTRELLPESKTDRSQEGLTLILPANLRRSAAESLNDDVMQKVSLAIQEASKLYLDRVSRVEAFILQIKQLVRGLYRNEKKTTSITKRADGGLFKAPEDVVFTFEHTYILEVPAVKKALDASREGEMKVLEEWPPNEIYMQRDQAFEDACSQILLLSSIADYLVHTSVALQSSPVVDHVALSTIQGLAHTWLYAIVDMEGPITDRYPVTRDHLLPILGKLSSFVRVDLASQMQLIGALRGHPNLVDQLAPALRPLELFSDTKLATTSHHENYVLLFTGACQLRIKVRGEQTKVVAVDLLERFQIGQWLGTMKPPVQYVISLFNVLSTTLQDQYNQVVPSSSSKAFPFLFVKEKNRAVHFLLQMFAECAGYEFPLVFSDVWTVLLQQATSQPLRIPPKAWTMVADKVPLTKLRWSKLTETISQLGSHLASLASTVGAGKSEEVLGNVASDNDDGSRKNNGKEYASTGSVSLPPVYGGCGASAVEILGFIKELVLAGVRKLHFVKTEVARAARHGQAAMSLREMRETLSKNMNELWSSTWDAFEPWLCAVSDRGLSREAPTMTDNYIPEVHAVCTRFAEIVCVMIQPGRIIPNAISSSSCPSPSFLSQSRFELWNPSDSIGTFFDIYVNKLAPKAQPRMLTWVHQALVQELTLVNHPSVPKSKISWVDLEWTKERCDSVHMLLKSFWAHNDTKMAGYKVQETVSFIVNLLCDANLEQMVPSKALTSIQTDEYKIYTVEPGHQSVGQVDAKEMSSRAISLLVLVSHCCLIEQTPYPPSFTTLLRKLMHVDWQIIDRKQYMDLLLSVSDLLYQNPGHAFENIRKTKPQPPPRKPNGLQKNSADVPSLEQMPSTNSAELTPLQSPKVIDIETREQKGTDSKAEIKAPQIVVVAPPVNSSGDSKDAAQSGGGEGKMQPLPPIYKGEDANARVPNNDQKSEITTAQSSALSSARSSQPGHGPPRYSDFSQQTTHLNPIREDEGGAIEGKERHVDDNGEVKELKISKSQLMSIVEGEAAASAYAATAFMDHDAKNVWVPQYRRDRAAFVLRMMLSMALPFPLAPFHHSQQTTREGLAKTQLYFEWLLSVFYNEGPDPVTSNIVWYIQLAKQVLGHLNKYARELFETGTRNGVVRILRECSAAAEAAEQHELKLLTETLTTDYPNLACEVITSMCEAASSPSLIPEKVDMCIRTALGKVDKAQVSSRRILDPSEAKAVDKSRGINNIEFSWKLVADALTVNGDRAKLFYEACSVKGSILAQCGVTIKFISASLPAAFDPDAKQSEMGNSPAFKAATQAVHNLTGNLSFMTLRRIELAGGQAEKIRELEHALINAMRLILGAQISIIRHAPSQNISVVERKQVFDDSDTVIAALTAYLRKAYRDGAFGSNSFRRFGGRMAKFFGSKNTGDELTPRFRLLARSLFTFIALREEENSSSKTIKYNWSLNCLEQTKAQQKLMKHFSEQVKAKPFRYLTQHIQQIKNLLGSSSLTLYETDKFLIKVVVLLFPGLPWPVHWLHSEHKLL